MNKYITFFIGLLIWTARCFGQELIDVTEQTIKLGGHKEEELYFGFAAGDKIIFSFMEADNKELKEIEIIEYPNNSRFSDYKVKRIENKTINVAKTGVFIFRFQNSAIAGRICKIKIQRIPANEDTKNFNSSVTWITKQDTIWNTYTKDVIIGYDTTYVQKTKKELLKIDTIFTPLFDKILRVHSETAIGKSQYTYATVEFPQNTYYPNQYNPYNSTEVVCWTYWIGVGQKAREAYDKANKNLSMGISAIGALTGYGALASLAVSGISIFANTEIGDNVRYKFYGMQNGQNIIYDYGNVITASGRNDKITQGSFSVELYNDNFREGIDVTLKMIVMQLTKTWRDTQYTEQKIVPRYEKKIFSEPVIKTLKIPINR